MLHARPLRVYVAAVLLCLAAIAATRSWNVTREYGYDPDPAGTRRFLRELEQPLFADAGRDAIRQARGVDTFLYRSANAAHLSRYGEPWIVGKQGIGDCLSWGWAHGVYVAAAVDWAEGEIPEPPLFPATEAVYGGSRCEARGRSFAGWSDGSYGGAAARWCRDWGVLWRQPYDGHDLTRYSADRAKQWGAYGNGGKDDNGRLDEVAKQHPCRHVALVTTFDEAAAAIESGYPVPVCSMVGFSSRRDADGFCSRSGRWAHCMCFVAVRYGSRPGLLCLNSWGPSWVGGPKWPDDQPDGSFWVDKSTVNAMLAGEDSFAVGGVDGFAYRDLSHGDWLDEN